MSNQAPGYKVLKATATRLDNIYQYTCQQWGQAQAEQYIKGLFNHFEALAKGEIAIKPIPAEFGVQGFVSCYQHHLVYSKPLSTGRVGIVTVLHERMHQIERFNDDFRFK